MQELLTVLDTKYKRLEYIQSTGTQWIDTGVSGVGLEIEHDIQFTDTTRRQLMGFVANHINYWGINASGYYELANNVTTVLAGNRDKVTYKKIDVSHSELYINGNLEKSYSSGTTEITTTYNLFRMYGYTTLTCSCKLYSCRVKQNNVLIRNMIPVLRKSDNEIGMLDLVEGKFYGNAGTGKFTANLDTMYALIQGTPTVQDGRVSGFSSSNYLETQQSFNLSSTTKAEFVFKINSNSFINDDAIFGSLTNYGLSVLLNQFGNLQLFIGNYNSWTTTKTSSVALSLNTDYWVKLVLDNNVVTLYYSTDGITYNIAISSTNMNLSTENNYNIGIGRGRTTSAYFRGSIDLKETYIKIDDTKYKLQAVVGYTKVGSPTITDGVVSGIDSSNYLKILQTYNLTQDINIEIQTRFKIDVTTGAKCLLNIGNIYSVPLLQVYDNYISGLLIGDLGTAVNERLKIDTYYVIKIKISNGKTRGYLYNDNGTLRASKNSTLSSFDRSGTFLIGAPYGTANPTVNSIDLNNTYIKINNKLWFNGLEA